MGVGGLTCYWSLNVQQVLLSAQDGGSLADEPQGHALFHTALFGEVGLKDIYFGLAFTVEDLLHSQPVAGGEWDSCKKQHKREANLMSELKAVEPEFL